VERLWADTQKARRLTDWQPRFTGREGFLKGLEQTAAWLADPRNLAAYKPHVYNI
jgi:dTDP-glucose 4,6-dehydratase